MDKIDKYLRILKTMTPLLSITSVRHIYVCSEKFCLRFMNLNFINAIILNSLRNFYDRSLSGAAVGKVTPNQVERQTLDRHLNKDFSLLLTINYNFCIPYFPISCRKKIICISSLFETLFVHLVGGEVRGVEQSRAQVHSLHLPNTINPSPGLTSLVTRQSRPPRNPTFIVIRTICLLTVL